ncbi:MAG: Rpn family recombination-promoting nuclease/putative transposase [Oscillospiraceae bacterium]|nr:Rpn family recombination-promoting nuclease/putative transposase [Oscillospiraceae bacterium]
MDSSKSAAKASKASGRNILKVKLDIIFKKLFSENEKLLTDLISSLLEIPIESIKNVKIKNSEVLPDSIEGKFVKMDLNMEVDGRLINIEMQYGKDYHYRERTLFYWSKLYSGELKSGEGFKDLKQSICINIVNFPIFDCAEYHSHFAVMEKNRGEILTDKCAIHFFELGKISRKANRSNKMELWLQLINAETEEEFEMLNQTGIAPIQEAVYIIYQMSEDEKIQEAARLREKALHIEVTNMEGAKEEGLQEGLQKGLQKGRQEGRQEGLKEGLKKGTVDVARRLLSRNRPIEEIAEDTGLTAEEIIALLN